MGHARARDKGFACEPLFVMRPNERQSSWAYNICMRGRAEGGPDRTNKGLGMMLPFNNFQKYRRLITGSVFAIRARATAHIKPLVGDLVGKTL